MNARQVAYDDQYRAAVAETRQLLNNVARRQNLAPTTADSPWLTAQFRALTRALATGKGRLCPHLGASPTLAHAAAWKPGLLVCSRCVALLRPDAAEDARCDRCRRSAPLYAGCAADGPVALTYGLCEPCAHATGLHPHGRNTR